MHAQYVTQCNHHHAVVHKLRAPVVDDGIRQPDIIRIKYQVLGAVVWIRIPAQEIIDPILSVKQNINTVVFTDIVQLFTGYDMAGSGVGPCI